jgi:oligopeptide/dipeptide ABC transporter ATP-binding protein
MAPLVEALGLKKYYRVGTGIIRQAATVRAVDGVSLQIEAGRTLGLVGESGSGKSTIGRLLLNLEPPTAGRVLYEGRDITNLHGEAMRKLRKDMQIIFQDPYSSLNLRMRVRDILAEPFQIHGQANGNLRAKISDLLDVVGLDQSAGAKFPHEFSGGQRQRIVIARAIALHPRFVVCDEPLSALDVSVQAQIINLLRDLQRELGLAYLFISHDLSVVRYLTDRVAVMYLGRVVELGPKADVFAAPLHPYTQSLMSAIPVPHPRLQRERKRFMLKGDVPSPLHHPPGCPFHTRCPFAESICQTEVPEFRAIRPDHVAACHLAPLPTTSVVSEVVTHG